MTGTAKTVRKLTSHARTFFDARPITSLLTLVGMIAGGVWAAESRWANAAATKQQIAEVRVEAQQQIAGVKELYLRSEQRSLQAQEFELERAAQRRRLTPLEEKRLKQVRDDLQRIEQDIQNAQRQQTPPRPPR